MATDLRIRLEFEGAVAGLKLPSKVQVGRPIQISSGQITCDFKVAYAVFGDFPITMHTNREGNKAWIDIVLYNGKQTQIDFNKISMAVIVFALSINPAGPGHLFYYRFEARTYNLGHLITAKLDRIPYPDIFLTVPTRPMPSGKQKADAFARLGSKNPWKYTAK